MPVVPAAAVSGLIFGALHPDHHYLAMTATGGTLLALSYHRTQSLTGSMIVHSTLNAMQAIMLKAAGHP